MSVTAEQQEVEKTRLEELAKAKSLRTVPRSSVSRLINNLNALSKDPNSDEDDVDDQLALLLDKQELLIKLDSDVIRYSVAGKDLEKETETTMDYQDRITMCRRSAERWLRKHRAPSGASSSSSTIMESTHKPQESKLPELSLPKFSGDFTEWDGFWSQFQTAVDERTTLTQVQKFTYLTGYLEGDAKRSLKGMKASDENYLEAIRTLKERFGRSDLVIHAHSKRLMRVNPVTDSNNIVALRNLYDTIQVNIRCLSGLGVDAALSGNFICPVLIACLPPDIRLEYSRSHLRDAEWNLTALVEFLRKEVEGRETRSLLGEEKRENRERPRPQWSNQNRDRYNSKPNYYDKHPSNQNSATASVLSNNVTPKEGYCIFCKTSAHATNNCKDYTLDEKKRIVRETGRCCICLRRNHETASCRSHYSTCKKCHKSHNFAICEKNEANRLTKESETAPKESVGAYVSTLESDQPRKTILLQTAKIIVNNPGNPNNSIQSRCLLDTGSQATFIKEDISRRLKLPVVGEQVVMIAEFGNKFPKEVKSRKVRLVLRNIHDPDLAIEIIALEVPYVCQAVTVVNSKEIEEFSQKRGIKLADEASHTSNNSSDIGILIGADFYWDIVSGKIERFGQHLVALETLFGWSIQGPVDNGQVSLKSNAVNVMRVNVEEAEISKTLRGFWEIESLGINQNEEETQTEKGVLESFRKTIKLESGRYQVEFPWKTPKDVLPNNFSVANKRMKSLVKRFKEDPILFQEYKKIIEDQLESGVAEEISMDDGSKPGTFYLPHQPVRRESSQTTKLRVVFDASSHVRGSPSLNDCLSSGPSLNPDLLLLLLQFRQHPIAITSDIEKAFLQVGLATEDKDSVRFLWIKETEGQIEEDDFKILRMTRVPFGITSSPFLLGATIKSHIQKYTEIEPDAARILDQNLYVDDLVSGAQTVEEAFKLSNTMSGILNEAGMTLRKWQTNSVEL